MFGIPSGLNTLANASLDSGVLSFTLYGDDRQQLHWRAAESQFPEYDPETAQVAVCCPSYGLDLVHCGELLRVPIG